MRTTVAAGRELPVGKIVCVGRNYAEHAREMGVAPPDRSSTGCPSEPVLFLKPSTALLVEPTHIYLPSFSTEVHHEVELVVRVGRLLCRASPQEAAAAVDAVALGLDLTARDLQAQAKKAGLPWAVAKGFDGAAPLSALVPVDGADALASASFTLEVNGVMRQAGACAEMLWPLPQLIAHISARFTLEPGDLVFSGTPAGVAALRAGDQVRGTLNGAVLLVATVHQRE